MEIWELNNILYWIVTHFCAFKNAHYSFFTTPLILNIVFSLSVEFDLTTMTFEKLPVFSVLYLIFISPFLFGRIGSFGHDGTVQPHDENADVIISGSLPIFSNSKKHSPDEPLEIVS